MSERRTSNWLVVGAVLAAAIPAGGQAPGDVFRDCDVCPEMVALPEGDVALGRYEVTLDEYRAFAEESTDPREREGASPTTTGAARAGGLRDTCRPGDIRWRA